MSILTSFPPKPQALGSRAFNTLTVSTAQFSIKEHEDYELPVIATHIHGHILPGFKYRVRFGGTNDYMFGGKALKLESIGKGYGKRITFESDDILENDNFFWSDSHEAGFMFSPEILSGDEAFQVMDTKGKTIGTFSVDSVNKHQQITGVTLEKNMVNIHAKVGLSGNMRLFSQTKDVPLAGDVIVKVNRFSCTMEFLETNNDTFDCIFVKMM